MTEDDLRALYAETLAEHQPADRKGCLAPDDVTKLVARYGAQEELLQWLDHVMSCPPCHGEFELLRSIATSTRDPPPHRFRPWLLATVSALALIIAAAITWRVTSSHSSPRDLTVVPLTPTGTISADTLSAFVWRAVPGALRYLVVIVDAEGVVLSTHTTGDTVMPWLDAAPLDPETSYGWRVRALLEDGSAVRGALTSFRAITQ